MALLEGMHIQFDTEPLKKLNIAVKQIYEGSTTRIKVHSVAGGNHKKVRRHSLFVIQPRAATIDRVIA